MTRGEEIQNWLDNHNDIDGFVVVDDDTFGLGDLISRTVKTDTMTGLQDSDINKAISILDKPL